MTAHSNNHYGCCGQFAYIFNADFFTFSTRWYRTRFIFAIMPLKRDNTQESLDGLFIYIYIYRYVYLDYLTWSEHICSVIGPLTVFSGAHCDKKREKPYFHPAVRPWHPTWWSTTCDCYRQVHDRPTTAVFVQVQLSTVWDATGKGCNDDIE